MPQRTSLRKQKENPHNEKKYLKIISLVRDFSPAYISNKTQQQQITNNFKIGKEP